MTLPASTFPRQADVAGTNFAGHSVNSKFHSANVLVGPAGHIVGTTPTYNLIIPPQAVGASKVHFDLFNAHASLVVRVRAIYVVVASDVAQTGLVSIRLDWHRTSSAGTGGTAATNSGTVTTAPTFTTRDSANGNINASITARSAPTAAATLAGWFDSTYHSTEETLASTLLQQHLNILGDVRDEQDLILRQNEGIKAIQGTVAGLGNVGFGLTLTVE